MRTREENKEYIQKYRFDKAKERMKEDRVICQKCFDRLATTIHHKNEDHGDFRRVNRLPVCSECHLILVHTCDIPRTGRDLPLNAPNSQDKRSKVAMDRRECYQNFYNPISHIRLVAWISLKTGTFLETLGFVKEAN